MELGKLIVIEGTDSSGKETQSKILVERLNNEGIKSEMISFPRYETPTGRIIGECYLGKKYIDGKLVPGVPGKSWFPEPTKEDPYVTSPYYSIDRLAATPYMVKTLESGVHLLANRFKESNDGHQGGKITDKEKRLEFWEDMDFLEHDFLKIPRPNAVIFLYMPWQVAKELKNGRGGHQDAHESDDEHLKNAENAYIELADLRKWIRIDCAPNGYPSRKIENIAEEVYQKVKPILL